MIVAAVASAIPLALNLSVEMTRASLEVNLVYAVAEYARVHAHCLPKDWGEFVEWDHTNGPNQSVRSGWDLGWLERNYALAWGKRACRTNRDERLFIILDLKYADGEGERNEILRESLPRD